MRAVLLAIVVCVCTSAHADIITKTSDVDACTSKPPSDAINCLNPIFKREDDRLNREYRRVRAAAGSLGISTATLTAAQRAWITYKERGCEFELAWEGGASLGRVSQARCLVIETRRRADQLAEFPSKPVVRDAPAGSPEGKQASIKPMVVREFPKAFRGQWSQDIEGCTADFDDSRIVIEKKAIEFYESRGVLLTAVVDGPREVAAVGAFTGEGFEWVDTLHFLVSDDGRELSSPDDQLFERIRCP